MTVVAPGIDN